MFVVELPHPPHVGLQPVVHRVLLNVKDSHVEEQLTMALIIAVN